MLGAVLFVGGWAIGLPILLVASLWPGARLARRLLLVWLLAPVALFVLTWAWISLEERADKRENEERAERSQQFCKDHEQSHVDAEAVAAIRESPTTLLLTYSKPPGDAGGIPTHWNVAEAVPCDQVQFRELQYLWIRDGKELLGRASTCPVEMHELEPRKPDADYELVLGRTTEKSEMPIRMLAFSAEIRSLRSGQLIAARTLCAPDGDAIGPRDNARVGLARLLEDAFPGKQPRPSP